MIDLFKAIKIKDFAKASDKAVAAQSSREHARAYALAVRDAINLLSEFDDKRVDSVDTLRDLHSDLKNSGVQSTLVTSPDRYSFLVDSEGNIVATHYFMPEAQS